MTRVIATLAASLTLASLAPATVAPPQAAPARLDFAALKPAAPVRPAAATPAADFAMSKETEVLLDGRACSYKDIPASASITKIEVAADRVTVIRIEFRSAK